MSKTCSPDDLNFVFEFSKFSILGSKQVNPHPNYYYPYHHLHQDISRLHLLVTLLLLDQLEEIPLPSL
ncbi:unnamed protein product [Callosobruchus maculatus]|uniref:Uncharacterized protein n=1 Tax=Callosobruchus maculatus TaxID=64391 RepID=A0A653DUA2_CALMS|nr:unnamed protein product [Callosobruchus maculatus]